MAVLTLASVLGESNFLSLPRDDGVTDTHSLFRAGGVGNPADDKQSKAGKGSKDILIVYSVSPMNIIILCSPELIN